MLVLESTPLPPVCCAVCSVPWYLRLVRVVLSECNEMKTAFKYNPVFGRLFLKFYILNNMTDPQT